MTEEPDFSIPLTCRERKQAIAGWEALLQREREEGLALLRLVRRAEVAEKRFRRMIDLWPLWAGMVIGLMGPAIRDITSSIGSWCMMLAFPFVVLAKQPEIQVGPSLTCSRS